MEKLYEFKKKRLYDNPLMGSHYTFVPGPYRIKFRLESKNDVFSKIFASGQSRITLKEYDELVKNVCILDFSRERITSEEEIERYMESFANGEIELSPNRWTYLYNCDEVYPTTLNVERNYVNITPHNFLAVLHVEPVFILGGNLMLLKSLEQLLVSTNDDATRSSIIKKFEEYFNQKGTLSYDESKRIIIEYLIRYRIVHTSYEYKDDDDIPNKEFDLVESFEEDIIKTYYVKFFSYEHPFVRIKYDGDFQKFLDKVEQERTEYLTTGKLPFEKKTPGKSKL